MRYAGKIRLQHTHRIYTDLTAEVSEESRKKFGKIIEIDTTGVSGLMPDFKDAITAALTSLKDVGRRGADVGCGVSALVCLQKERKKENRQPKGGMGGRLQP